MKRLSGSRGAVALAVLFGLNIPACAGPLLVALLAPAALGAARIAEGFVILAVFGLALSLPLVLAALWEPARRALDRHDVVAPRPDCPRSAVRRARNLVDLFRAFLSPEHSADVLTFHPLEQASCPDMKGDGIK
jgi:hypothetical protein